MRNSYTDEEMERVEILSSKTELTDDEMSELEVLSAEPSQEKKSSSKLDLFMKTRKSEDLPDELTDDEMDIVESVLQEKDVEDQQGKSGVSSGMPSFLNEDDLVTTKQDVERASSFAEGFKVGAKEQLDPFHLVSERTTEEEEERLAKLPATVGRIAGNMGVDLAMTAASGAIAGGALGSVVPVFGTAVGALVGGVVSASLFAMYRAFGTENVESERQDREFDITNVGVNALVELNPVLKYGGSKIAKVGKAVIQGSLNAKQASQYGAETSGTVVASMLGVTAGYFTKGNHTISGLAKAPKEVMDFIKTKHVTSLAKAMDTPQTVTSINALNNLVTEHANNINEYLDQAVSAGRMVNKNIEAGSELIIDAKGKLTGFKMVGDVKDVGIEKFAADNGLAIELIDMGTKSGSISVGLNNGVLRLSHKWKSITDPLIEVKLRANVERQVKRHYNNFTDHLKSGNKLTTDRALSDYSKLDLEQRQMLWADYIGQETRKNAIVKSIRTGLSMDIGSEGDASKFGAYMSDGLLEARKVDRVTRGSTNFESTINELIIGENKSNIALASWLKEWDAISKKLKETKHYDLAFDYLDTPTNFGSVPAEAKRAAAFLDDFRAYVKDNGFDIGEIENYVPYVRRSPTSLGNEFTKNVSIIEKLNPESEEFAKAMREVKDVMSYEFGISLDENLMGITTKGAKTLPVGSNATKQFSFKELRDYGKKLFDGGSVTDRAKGNIDLASGMKTRGVKIEGFVETDIDTVMKAYLTDMVHTIHMSKPERRFFNEVNVLKTLNTEVKGKFTNALDWSQFMLSASLKGINPNKTLRNATSGVSRLMKKNMAEYINDVDTPKGKANLASAVSDIPDLLSVMSSSIYSWNLGGINVYKAIRNLAQSVTFGSPELGTYGITKVGGLVKDSLKNYKSLKREMQDKGLFNPDQGRLISYLQEGTAKGAYNKVSKFNEKMMSLFTLAEEANRVHMYNVAKHLAQDILQGDRNAYKTLMNRGTGIKMQAKGLIDNQDVDGLTTLLGADIIGHTMFHYSKITQSQFQQQFGTLTSMFAKFPTMSIGKAAQLTQEGKKAQLLIQYLAMPTLLLGVGFTAKESGILDNKRTQFLHGKSISDITSAGALSSVLTIEPSAIISGIGDFTSGLRDVTNLEIGKGVKGMSSSVLNVTGSSGAVRQAKMLWQLITGEDPLGSPADSEDKDIDDRDKDI